jgi:starch-binding outer membrane protein, SusD/RagB family
MKKKINLLFTVLFIASLLMTYSCSEDFLTKEPPGVASASQMNTKDGVEALLIGTYQATKGTGRFGAAMATDWTYASGASDDAYKGTSSGDQVPFNEVERFEVLPSSAYVRERWRDCYNGVARANVVLEALWATQKTAAPFDDTRAKQVEAEAKFLRAWFHFEANKVFEKIPYIKTVTELGTTLPEQVPNTDAGWTGIEADLQFAIDNLPTTKIKNEAGRITKYAAEAVKADVFMAQNKFSSAKPLLDDILANTAFGLVDFYWNFDMTHENNKESIFELQCATTGTSQQAMMLAGPCMHQAGPASCGGWGFFQPSEDLFEAYQVDANGLPILDPAARVALANDMGKGSGDNFVPTTAALDPRVDWTIARRGVDYLGWGIHVGNSWIREQNNGGPYMTKKYMHKKEEQSLNANGTGFDNGKNYRMYRLSHIILWRAEVAAEAGTPADLEFARTLVNQIRNRAKTSTPVMGLCTTYANLATNPVVDYTKPAANYKVEPYPVGAAAFATKTEALKAIREEMRLEFATENRRFFDLRRWGLLGTVIPAYIIKDGQFRTFLRGAVFNLAKNDYWPLPQDQIDLQKGVLAQDPAY